MTIKKAVRFSVLLSISILFFSCSKNNMVPMLDGCFKDLDGNYLTQEQLTADYYLVYYGASWCPYCVEMKDEITDFYNTYKSDSKLLMLFAGCKKDKSNDDLTEYLKEESYPFPYLDFDHRDQSTLFTMDAYTSCETFYIPAFILFDKSGRVLSSTNGPKETDYLANRPLEYYKENLH